MPYAWRVGFVLVGFLAALHANGAAAEEQFAGGSMDTLARAYATPHAIAAFLHREFTFTRDEQLFEEVEYWQTPEEFLSRQRGDCEDFALLAAALLRRAGYEAHVFSVIGEGGYAHTVCVFKDAEGRYNVINQDKIRYYRAASLEAVATQLYPGWRYGGIAEQAGRRGRLVKRIVNLRPVSAWPTPATFPAF